MNTDRIGNKISETRKQKGWSQEALAEASNISLSTIQRIERGNVTPRPFTLKTLADCLEIDLSILNQREKETIINIDFTFLKKISLISMVFSIIPFANILAPLILWKKNKHKEDLRPTAGKIISFQILWSFTVLFTVILTELIIYIVTGLEGYRPFPIEFILYVLFVIINVFITIQQVIKLNKKETTIFKFIPNFF